jgi:hypothetical protein
MYFVPEGQLERTQALRAWTGVWTFTEGHVGREILALKPKGREGSTLGTRHPERRALKRRQIEGTNNVASSPVVARLHGALYFSQR